MTVEPQSRANATGDKPLVSIIMPSYNSGQFVAEAIQSALDQTYENIEVIVIDDGSTDNSLEIIRSFGSKIYWETGPNKGACIARNRGIDLAEGEYIKFLDADDILALESIERQVEISGCLPADTMVYGYANSLEKDCKRLTGNLSGGEDNDSQIAACISGDILIACPLHRKRFIDDHQVRFDPLLKNGQEWNFHVRCALSGMKFVFHDVLSFAYRKHEGSDRISNLPEKERRRQNLHTYLSTAILVDSFYSYHTPEIVKEAVYKRMYSLGRQCARLSMMEESNILFAYSKSIKCARRPKCGRMPYHLASYFIPPYFLERITEKARLISRKLS